MAEIVERRKVIIEFENRISGDLGSVDDRPSASTVSPELVEAVRRELIRIANRNGSTGIT